MHLKLNIVIKHSLVSILFPQNSSLLISGIPVRLWARLNTSITGDIKIKDNAWILNDKPTGQTIDSWIAAPKNENTNAP
jgi:hypothetical protein